MKRKILLILLVVVFVVSIEPRNVVCAAESFSDNKQYHLSTGGFFRCEVKSLVSDGEIPVTTEEFKTIKGKKTITYYDAEDNELFSISLIGVFAYVYGERSTCINLSLETKEFNSGICFSHYQLRCEEEVAHVFITAKRMFSFLVVDTFELNLELSCDIYGNLT